MQNKAGSKLTCRFVYASKRKQLDATVREPQAEQRRTCASGRWTKSGCDVDNQLRTTLSKRATPPCGPEDAERKRTGPEWS